jgi:hypothetical protein
MLEDLIKAAIDIKAERIEIEHESGEELVTAFRGPMGVGIAHLDRAQWHVVFKEMQEIKRRNKINVGDATYRLAFSKYDSFGEWVFVVDFEIDRKSNRGVGRKVAGKALLGGAKNAARRRSGGRR